MEETSLASPREREEISIFGEEKPRDHSESSSNSCSPPKEIGSISDQKQCPLDVPNAEILDEFQDFFRVQEEEEQYPSVIENLDSLPTAQENSPLNHKSPEEATHSLGTTDEEQGEECNTDEEHSLAHERIPETKENSTNKTSNKILTAEVKENVDFACSEEYSNLDLQPEICFAEQQEHQDGYATFHIAEDKGAGSTGTQDDLVQTKNQTDQLLPSSDSSRPDLVASDADVFEECVNVSKTEEAEPIQKEAVKTGTEKQIFTAQEMTADDCADTSRASDDNKLRPHLNWAFTAVETDPNDGTSVQTVFPLQFTKLVIKTNEGDLQNNPTVKENICEKHEVSYFMASPTEGSNIANCHFITATDSSAPHKPSTDVLTASEDCIDIRENPDDNICCLTIENALQTVVPEHDNTHLTNTAFVKLMYKTPTESCAQPQVNGGSKLHVHDNNNPNTYEEMPCFPAEENGSNLNFAHVADTSVNETPKAEEKAVICFFATTASVEEPNEEIIEEQLNMAPPFPLFHTCNTLPATLVTNVPQELHLLPFTSESTHLALGPQEVEITQATSSEIPSVFEPLESSTNVTPIIEHRIEATDSPSLQNSSFVCELEDHLYDSNNPGTCGEIPCSPAYENVENLNTADVEDDGIQKVEKKVTCCIAAPTSAEVPWEEIVEEQLTMAPPAALVANAPQELHLVPFTSESTHLTLEPERLEIAQATSSEIPDVFDAVPIGFILCERVQSNETKEEGPDRAWYSEAQTSQTPASDEYHSTAKPRILVHSFEEAIDNIPAESLPQHPHVVLCEEPLQLHGEILPKEAATSKEKEGNEAYSEEADVIISVQAAKPCMEMPKSLSNYIDNRQYESANGKDFNQITEQNQNGQASEDFDNRYAEFVGRVLPGFEIYYSKKPNQVSREVGPRTGVFSEMQNRELAAVLPISLYKPAWGHHRAQKRRLLEPEPAINDDYLYPDAVTPTKVEKSLNTAETNMENKENRYDVPFIDDDAFLPRRLRSPSNSTPITDDETSSELGYSYGYYEGRYTKSGHLANDDDEKSNQELVSLTGSQRAIQASNNSFRWDFSLKMCGCLQRRRRRRL